MCADRVVRFPYGALFHRLCEVFFGRVLLDIIIGCRAGCAEFGVRGAEFVNEIADGGEIILQKAVEVKDGDTPEILQRRVMEQAEWLLLPQAVELVSQEIIRQK